MLVLREIVTKLKFVYLYPLIKLYSSTKNQLSASAKQNKCSELDTDLEKLLTFSFLLSAISYFKNPHNPFPVDKSG